MKTANLISSKLEHPVKVSPAGMLLLLFLSLAPQSKTPMGGCGHNVLVCVRSFPFFVFSFFSFFFLFTCFLRMSLITAGSECGMASTFETTGIRGFLTSIESSTAPSCQ